MNMRIFYAIVAFGICAPSAFAQIPGNAPATSVYGNPGATSVPPAFTTTPVIKGLTINPTAFTLNQGLLVAQQLSGVATTNQYFSNIISIATDNADFSGSATASNYAFWVDYTVGGLSARGGRGAIVANISLASPTSPLNAAKTYVALSGHSIAASADGGTNTGLGALGQIFGSNISGRALAGAVNLGSVVGLEINTSLDAGSSSGAHVGLQIVQLLNHAVSGAAIDAALRFVNQPGALGWNVGIQFDNLVAAPLKATGCAICSVGSWTVGSVLDFSSVTVTNNFLLGPGSLFGVTGAGAVKGVNYSIGAVLVLQVVGNDLLISDTSSHVNMTIGNATSTVNFYDQSTHSFRSRTGANFFGINGSGIILYGSTSGTLTQAAPAIAGTIAVNWGTSNGTPAVTASLPLAITTATGNITCTTCGVTGSPLSQFAATTSAQLAGVISDETGSGALVFGTSPTLTTAVAAGTWTASGTWTLPAFTLGGTVSGGGNQINNVIIGTSTPLAGTFTTLTGTTVILAGASTTPEVRVVDSGTNTGSFTFYQSTSTLAYQFGNQTGAFFVFDAVNSRYFVRMNNVANTLELATGGTIALSIGSTGTVVTNNGTTDATSVSTGSLINKGGFATNKRVWMDGLTAASGTPTSICRNANEITVNAALTCTVSSLDFKNDFMVINGEALPMVMAMQPGSFAYKDHPERQRFGFAAEYMAAVDRRFGDGWDKDDHPRSIDQNAILAVAVKALQELKADNDNLRSEFEALKRKVAR